MMATSCPGKVVSGRAIHRLVDSWKLQTLRSTITVSYHMGHTLQEMGFTLRSLEIPPENLRQIQRPQEQPGVSGDYEVKKELMDVPEIPKPKEGEVIDLTEDKDIARSSEETAMDLSMKSTGDKKVDSGSHSDDGYNSDNLCIVEDKETGEAPPNPSRPEEESNVNADSGKNPADNTVQADEKVESPPEDVEMVEPSEHPVNENEDNDMDTNMPNSKENEGNNEVQMAPETETHLDKDIEIDKSNSTSGENKGACSGPETGAEKENVLEQTLHNSADEMAGENNTENEIGNETGKQVENGTEKIIESEPDKEVENNENNVELPGEKESKSTENESIAKVTDDTEQDDMQTKPSEVKSSETVCEDMEKSPPENQPPEIESEIGSEEHVHSENKDAPDKESKGISEEVSLEKGEVSAQNENESENGSSDKQEIGHSEDRLDDQLVIDGGEEDEFETAEEQEPAKEIEKDNEQKDGQEQKEDNR